MQKAMDIFARSCHYAFIEFDGLAQCFEKLKPIDLPVKVDTVIV
jgi:hypothetical protein